MASMPPDPWQSRLLQSQAKQILICCSRQAGKSQSTAAKALHRALCWPGQLVVILSASQKQANEFLAAKLVPVWKALGRPYSTGRPPTATTLSLANGSRILSLPSADPGTIVGYSKVNMLVIDEAARVDDVLYYDVRPMLAISGGTLIALSTPFGKRGWFYEEWRGSGPWERYTVRASECPRISRAFLAEERRSLGERWYRQAYECSFEETIDSVFSRDEIDRAVERGRQLRPLVIP